MSKPTLGQKAQFFISMLNLDEQNDPATFRSSVVGPSAFVIREMVAIVNSSVSSVSASAVNNLFLLSQLAADRANPARNFPSWAQNISDTLGATGFVFSKQVQDPRKTVNSGFTASTFFPASLSDNTRMLVTNALGALSHLENSAASRTLFEKSCLGTFESDPGGQITLMGGVLSNSGDDLVVEVFCSQVRYLKIQNLITDNVQRYGAVTGFDSFVLVGTITASSLNKTAQAVKDKLGDLVAANIQVITK